MLLVEIELLTTQLVVTQKEVRSTMKKLLVAMDM